MQTREETVEPSVLGVQAVTLFELTESGRLRRENSPNRSTAPRMWLAGSAAGNVARVRADVGAETAEAIDALARREPPLTDALSVPVHLDEYVELLGAEGPLEEV